jgi:hypothetical protein
MVPEEFPTSAQKSRSLVTGPLMLPRTGGRSALIHAAHISRVWCVVCNVRHKYSVRVFSELVIRSSANDSISSSGRGAVVSTIPWRESSLRGFWKAARVR